MTVLDLNAPCAAWEPFLREGGAALLQRAAEETVSTLGPAATVEIAICLDDDAAVHVLNKQYLGHDKPTNVLSFPSFEGAALAAACAGTLGLPQPTGLGDIILAHGVCARQAAEIGRSFAMHAVHLSVHGILHLFGYDHISDDDRALSESTERRIMAALGWPDPYPDETDVLHG